MESLAQNKKEQTRLEAINERLAIENKEYSDIACRLGKVVDKLFTDGGNGAVKGERIGNPPSDPTSQTGHVVKFLSACSDYSGINLTVRELMSRLEGIV